MAIATAHPQSFIDIPSGLSLPSMEKLAWKSCNAAHYALPSKNTGSPATQRKSYNWHLCVDGGVRHRHDAAIGMAIYAVTGAIFECIHRSGACLAGARSAFQAELIGLEQGLLMFAKLLRLP